MRTINAWLIGLFWNLRRVLRLTPIFCVMRELRRRGLNVESLHALDLFGGNGDMITRDYAKFVPDIEVWEIRQECRILLQKNVPHARVKIVDSFVELARTERKFSFVVADTWTRPFDGHCEHFELFPVIFRVLEPQLSIVMLNVLPWLSDRKTSSEHLQKRRCFYQVEDAVQIPVPLMVKRYEQLAQENGFKVEWWFYKDRYFLFPLRKKQLGKRLGFLVLALSASE